MRQTFTVPSLLLLLVGLTVAASPELAIITTTPEPYEVELMRWAGAAAVGLAVIRPWAIRIGGSAGRRMRRWTGLTVVCGVLYVVTTNPVFLVVGLSTLLAAVLDATVERATVASSEFLTRLLGDEA